MRLPIVLLWLVHRLGYLPVTYTLTDPTDNVNWVYGPGSVAQTRMHPRAYLALTMIFFPLAIYLPTHVVLRSAVPMRLARADVPRPAGVRSAPRRIEMPMLNLTVRHGRTLDDATRGLELTVQRVSGQFGPLVRRVEWAPDHRRVKLDGAGFWVEMWVDAQDVHATGDIPILAGLLGSQLGAGLKQIVQQTFEKKLP